jgi:bla regulator protein blaR1
VTPGLLLETLGSLALQVGVFLVICDRLARRTDDIVERDRQRARVHGVVLIMSAAGFLLPHWRWTVFAQLVPVESRPSLQSVLSGAAWVVDSVWLVGCVWYLVLIVRELWRGYLLVRESRTLPSDWGPTVNRVLAGANHLCAVPIAVRVSAHIGSPLLWQFHRPEIVIPESMLAFPNGEVEAVLRHEAAHFRARHPVQLFVQRVGEALFWYHPLVWRASQVTVETRELRCDVEAVSSSAEARDYLRSLVRLIESRGPGITGLRTGLAFLGSSQLLEKRLAAIVNRFDARSRTDRGPGLQRSRVTTLFVPIAAVLCGLFLWLPLNPAASQRSVWSPWPAWSAEALDPFGVQVRDYEVDGHRLRFHSHSG